VICWSCFLNSWPAAADDVEFRGTCNPVLDRSGAAVRNGPGAPIVHRGSYSCPPAQQVAALTQVEPAAPPEPLPRGGVVLFGFDSAEITPAAEAALNEMLADIRARELEGITVAGHTDTAGPASYNDGLSERRAEAIAAWLEVRKVPAEVIIKEAYGQTRPAVPTADGVPLEANRRVVVEFAY
jgi:outer membrane protein OmpA-like peptidoglycan-associated protein